MVVSTRWSTDSRLDSHRLVLWRLTRRTRILVCTNMKKGSGSWHPNTLEASDASGTYEFQAALPRLPVPPVAQSIKQYLHSVSHLMSPHEMESPATSTPRQDPSATSNMNQPGCCRSCQPLI